MPPRSYKHDINNTGTSARDGVMTPMSLVGEQGANNIATPKLQYIIYLKKAQKRPLRCRKGDGEALAFDVTRSGKQGRQGKGTSAPAGGPNSQKSQVLLALLLAVTAVIDDRNFAAIHFSWSRTLEFVFCVQPRGRRYSYFLHFQSFLALGL